MVAEDKENEEKRHRNLAKALARKSHLNWHDPLNSPNLNIYNALNYFQQPSNPFYDRSCNNEVIKMQRDMKGVEYSLHSYQEPFLFIICKQYRLSRSSVKPLSYYYILSGIVYQCPDLNSIITSKLYNISYLLSKSISSYNSLIKTGEEKRVEDDSEFSNYNLTNMNKILEKVLTSKK